MVVVPLRAGVVVARPAARRSLAVLHVVVRDRRTGVRRLKPVHRQAGLGRPPEGRRRRGGGRLGVDVGQRKRHRDAVGLAAVRDLHRDRIARLRLEVVDDARLRPELPAGPPRGRRTPRRFRPGSTSGCRRRGRSPSAPRRSPGPPPCSRGCCASPSRPWRRPAAGSPCPPATTRSCPRGSSTAPAPGSAEPA